MPYHVSTSLHHVFNRSLLLKFIFNTVLLVSMSFIMSTQ